MKTCAYRYRYLAIGKRLPVIAPVLTGFLYMCTEHFNGIFCKENKQSNTVYQYMHTLYGKIWWGEFQLSSFRDNLIYISG
jgi:hypothetical protein